MPSPQAADQLAVLKELLGRRRYRVAFLRFSKRMTQEQIARRLNIAQGTVSKDLSWIAGQFVEARRTLDIRQRTRTVTLDAFSGLN